ncbi:MAG: ASCH domain-containing protein, partial [Coprobacillus sp.]
MTEKEMWDAYITENPNYKNEIYEAWSYGSDTPDLLADLTLKGIKTATASAYPFYEYEKCDLPKEGLHNLIMNSKNEAVCIIKTTKIRVLPFSQVDARQAYREGEGDRSLAYWRDVHASVF